MTGVLQHVAKKEKFKLSDEVASNIVRDADGNTRKAVLMLEAMKMQQYVARYGWIFADEEAPVPIYLTRPCRFNQRNRTGKRTVITSRT